MSLHRPSKPPMTPTGSRTSWTGGSSGGSDSYLKRYATLRVTQRGYLLESDHVPLNAVGYDGVTKSCNLCVCSVLVVVLVIVSLEEGAVGGCGN